MMIIFMELFMLQQITKKQNISQIGLQNQYNSLLENPILIMNLGIKMFQNLMMR
jgi:hypothetical protein